ncbi:helix-turn-helix domain-containing protein [Amycolatopsis sp. GM8]|uniref:helix-turn-helix domain-containing protein n=1 Tax=Amycolatopsis sp. GM8 TaxID=2896530 RepID=UPI001F47F0DF|nr:helix-turn-helix domain-containing protein [Amycolatopsis sp. GM8]
MDTPHTNPGRVLLTVEAAAQALSIGRTTMYTLIKAGRIASVRVGHLRRVPAAALAAYVQQLATDQQAA